MADTAPNPPPFRTSANVFISSPGTSANAAWLGGECEITTETITLRAMGFEQVHHKPDIIELRWVKWLYPYAVVISQKPGGVRHYATIQMLRWSRLRAALGGHGYEFKNHADPHLARTVLQQNYNAEVET